MDDLSVLALASLGTVVGAVVQTVVSKNKRTEESLLAAQERLEIDLAEERALRAKTLQELEDERANREAERLKRFEAEQRRLDECGSCENRGNDVV